MSTFVKTDDDNYCEPKSPNLSDSNLPLLDRHQPVRHTVCHYHQRLVIVSSFISTTYTPNPCFNLLSSPSTHFSYKNFYLRGDDWLIVSRWQELMQMRDALTFVELVTWCVIRLIGLVYWFAWTDKLKPYRNDYGESD